MCSISNVQLFYYWITDTSQNIKFFNRGEKFPLSGPRRPWCSSFRFFENNSIFTTVHLPFHMSYFSNSSQNIIYRTLNFVMSFFLNYLGRLHTGLTCVSFRHVPWLPRPKKPIFIQAESTFSWISIQVLPNEVSQSTRIIKHNPKNSYQLMHERTNQEAHSSHRVISSLLLLWNRDSTQVARTTATPSQNKSSCRTTP